MSGRKGIQYFRFHKVPLEFSFPHLSDQPSWEEIESLSAKIVEYFEKDKVDSVWTIYGSKSSVIKRMLLPMDIENLIGKKVEKKNQKNDYSELKDDEYLYLPDTISILNYLVPVAIKTKIYEIFFDATVSEQTSRMLAMKSATDNAHEMITHLTRQYNRARQSQITQEILEIFGGSQA